MKKLWTKWIGLTVLVLAVIAITALDAWVEIQSYRAPDRLQQVVALGETDSAGGTEANLMTVLEVKAESRQIYCLGADGKLRVVEFPDGAVPLIMADGERRADLRLLKAGDLIKVEHKDGRAHTIVVLRRASEEVASPER